MAKGGRGYVPPVPVLLRLLAIAALLLMPIGMGMTPAAAATHATVSTATAEGHCDGAPQGKAAKGQVGLHCSGACIALPAEPARADAQPVLPGPSLAAGSVQTFHGTAPPPATPPPRVG